MGVRRLKQTLRVGLTGGIGSGKTTVSNLFMEHDVPVIDADVIAHSVVKKGEPAFNAIVHEFSDEILDSKGDLNRAYIRKVIFANVEKKELLEGIIHPQVRSEISSLVSRVVKPYCIISIPLLIESGLQSTVDRILVVDVPESLQIERASKRDKVDHDDLVLIINSQASREDRLKFADDVIRNDQDISLLDSQVENLDIKYREIASTNV
jgi:dephospho-CoA kinase